MPRMHVVQVISRPARIPQIPLMPGELRADGVLVEGGRFFAVGVVDVVGRLLA